MKKLLTITCIIIFSLSISMDNVLSYERSQFLSLKAKPKTIPKAKVKPPAKKPISKALDNKKSEAKPPVTTPKEENIDKTLPIETNPTPTRQNTLAIAPNIAYYMLTGHYEKGYLSSPSWNILFRYNPNIIDGLSISFIPGFMRVDFIDSAYSYLQFYDVIIGLNYAVLISEGYYFNIFAGAGEFGLLAKLKQQAVEKWFYNPVVRSDLGIELIVDKKSSINIGGTYKVYFDSDGKAPLQGVGGQISFIYQLF